MKVPKWPLKLGVPHAPPSEDQLSNSTLVTTTTTTVDAKCINGELARVCVQGEWECGTVNKFTTWKVGFSAEMVGRMGKIGNGKCIGDGS